MSTCESEWVAQSELILFSEEAHEIFRVLEGKDEIIIPMSERGPIWCVNRSVRISARKEDYADMPRKTRHVALRFCHVKEHAARMFFTPTKMQRSDALTKPPTAEMIRLLFHLPGKDSQWKEKQGLIADCTCYAVDFKCVDEVNFGTTLYVSIREN